jgi:hypothetical protein
MAINPAEDLWNSHEPAEYPSGVGRIRKAIVGTSFFPGGYGLWNPKATRPLPAFPLGGVMILGHDFHSEAGYEESLRCGMESESQPTWENLTDVLSRAMIPLEDCFFTNVYMGLRKGTKTTGPFPGRLDRGFREYCKSFLLTQISTQRPTLIVTLGIYVPEFLASLSPQLHQWSTKRGLKHLDAVGPVKIEVTFEQLPDFATTVVALSHPSMRGSNLRHRRYGELAEDAAEMQMLRDATQFAKQSARSRSAR